MWHVGIDLHRATVVLAAVSDGGEAMNPVTIPCSDTVAIRDAVQALGAFRAVIEATGTYRWLYDLLRPHGVVLLAHPLRLRAMIQRRTKTDKLDAQLLANLLRINQIPLADIHGIGLYSALLIIAELGEVERFRRAKQVGAYTGLTSRVHQSGGHCYQGSITRQGSARLRWVLVQAAMKAVREDPALRNFYNRIRKRSGAKIARVAAARKLAEICWKRLRRWHHEHASQAA